MKTVTFDQLTEWRKTDAKFPVINVLSAEDFKAGNIPGSINIPFGAADFTQLVEKQLGGKDKKFVVYCASEKCDTSEKAAKKLNTDGFTNVYDFAGGTKAWNASKKEVVKT